MKKIIDFIIITIVFGLFSFIGICLGMWIAISLFDAI